MLAAAPTLETERLILRGFRKEDLDAHAATLGDCEVMRHVGGKAVSREDSWRRMMAGVGSWTMLGMGPWAVELKADARLVGHCGFFQFEREVHPSMAGEPEMGWIFDRTVHGQGIAFEACSAALAWGDQKLLAKSYPAIIDPDNAPSIRLAERLGFVRLENASYKDKVIAFFRRPAKRS